MRFFFVIFVIGVMLFETADAAAARLKLTLACTELTPYTDPDRLNQGLSSDITDQVVKAAGYEANMVLMPWTRSFALAKRGEIDGIFCTTFIPDRLEHFAFTQTAVTVERYVLFKRKDRAITFNTTADLAQYRFAEVANSAWADYLAEMGITKILPVNAEDQKFKSLVAGRVDGVIADHLIGWSIIEACCASELSAIEVSGDPIRYEPLYIAISRSKHENADQIVTELDEAFTRLHKSGALRETYARHGFSGTLVAIEASKKSPR